MEEVIEKNSFRADREQPALTGVITISVMADGQLERVDITRSSGNRLVGNFALKIMREAPPFEPCSAEIRKIVDILSITRTFEMRVPTGPMGLE